MSTDAKPEKSAVRIALSLDETKMAVSRTPTYDFRGVAKPLLSQAASTPQHKSAKRTDR